MTRKLPVLALAFSLSASATYAGDCADLPALNMSTITTGDASPFDTPILIRADRT